MTHANRNKNRIIASIALAVMLVLTAVILLPTTVDAAGTTPTLVTSSNYSSLGLSSSYVGYYAIENADQLLWFSGQVSANNSLNGVLLNDIDLTGLTTWKIMETYYGTFDGRGYSIIGMNKNAGLADNKRPGFTAYLYGTVKNLTFKNADVFDQREIGAGVIAHNNYGTISRCMVLNSDVQLGNYAGMGFIAGRNYSGGVIEYCGVANSWMMRRYEGQYAQSMGGITQINNGTVRNCYTYNCSFNRGITGSDGALISSGNAPTSSYYYTNSTTITTYGTPKTAAEFNNGTVAVLLGSAYGQDIDTWNIPDEYPVVGGPTLYSMYYCHNSSLFAGYSNTNGAKAHQTYSSAGFCTYCDAYQPGTRVTSSNYSSLGLTADHEGYWALGNAGQLYWFSAVVKGNYNNKTQNTSVKTVLTANITVNSSVLNSSGGLNSSSTYREWIPIGNSSANYVGTFDGDGKTVSGLYYNNTSTSYIGLFGHTATGSVIKNVGVVDSYFSGNDYIGGVVGRNYYGTVTNCYNTGAVIGGHPSAYIGGVVGSNSTGTVTNCYNTGAVTCTGTSSPAIGGVVGYNYSSTVKGCYNTGALTCTGASSAKIGGVVGSNSTGTVTGCYYLTGTATGGIAGADAAGQAEAKTTAEFNSGEVAYLLQQGNTEQVWGQNIDNGETREYYPVFSAATVYARWYCDSSAIESYSNTDGLITHSDKEENYDNGFCTQTDCDGYQPATLVTSGNYTIGNAGQLYWFALHVNAGNNTVNATVTADIDATADASDDRCKYLGIGTESYPYKGEFNGGKHTIKLALEANNTGATALFDFIGGANIHDLHTTGTIYVPAPSTSGMNKFAAGIVSRVSSGTNTIERVTSDVIITSEINGDGTHGGLVGVIESVASLTLNNCGFSGAINGANTYACGGFIGWNNSSNLVITNCYQAGTFNLADKDNDTINRNIRAKTFTNVYYLNALGVVQGTYKSQEAFESGEVAYLLQKPQSTQVWGQNIDNGDTREYYPVFSSATVYARWYCDSSAIESYSNYDGTTTHFDKEENYDNGFCTYCDAYQAATLVTEGDTTYYAIGNGGQLYWFATVVNGGYGDVAQDLSANGVLISNIIVNNGVLVNGALNTDTTAVAGFRVWTPIGNSSANYAGTFDGNDKTISGLYSDGSTTTYVGLFGCTASAAVIKNVGVTDSYFYGIEFTGGIVGWNSGSVTNCYSMAAVIGTSQNTGGIAGYNYDGNITHCYNTGDISGVMYVGGIVGYNMPDSDTAVIANCYNTGNVSGSDRYIGGIVGSSKPRMTGSAAITNCYNTGVISGSSEIGGIAGQIGSNVTVTNCYYLDDSDTPLGGINSADVTDSAEARTTEAFQSGEVAYLLQLGQSTQVWGQNIDNGDTLEAFPVFSSAKVYEKLYCDGVFISYTNTAGVTVHIYDHGNPKYLWAEDHTSLTVTLTCTRVNTHTLSETTTEISINTTTDPDYIFYTGTVVLDSQAHTNTAEVFNEIISVTISWTDLTFVYTVTWNPDSLQYEGEWSPESEGGGVITVTNEGNVDMNVSFEYAQMEATVDGVFTDADSVTVTKPVLLTKKGGTTKVSLTLYGEPSEAFESATLGTVTVTVNKTDTASLP